MTDGRPHLGGYGFDRELRSTLEQQLDSTVRENRFTIAVVVPAVGAVTLVSGAEGWIPSAVAFNSLLVLTGVLVMRSPLIVGLLPIVDRRVVLGLGALGGYTYVIEFVGVTTGWPYGHFAYGVTLGPMVGGIPLALPVLFVPLVLNAMLLWLVLMPQVGSGYVRRIVPLIPTVVLMDVVLDPGAVALGLWQFEAGGFHGVPLTNFLGWVLSATVAVLLVEYAFSTAAVRSQVASCPYILDDCLSFVIFWGTINLWFGQWIPVAVAVGFGLAYLGAMVRRRETARHSLDVWPSGPS